MTLNDRSTVKELTQQLLEGMREEARKAMRKIDSCRDISGEGMKGIMRNGM